MSYDTVKTLSWGSSPSLPSQRCLHWGWGWGGSSVLTLTLQAQGRVMDTFGGAW